MTLQTKPLAQINQVDVCSLIESGVPEGRLIDYKRDLPGSTDGEKKEFLFDVSSFANSSGGHLVYGVVEEGGIPTQIVGSTVADTDAEIRRLEGSILESIEPRIPGFELRFVEIGDGKYVLVIHVPKSWLMPHMVTFKGTNKFYARNSAGKYPLDVGELRSLFSASETAAERIRRFRIERLGQIAAEETPILMLSSPKIILHLVPLQSFQTLSRIDLGVATTLPAGLLYPLGALGHHVRLNLDGLLHFQPDQADDRGRTGTYLQLYQNGIIETVDAITLVGYARNRDLADRVALMKAIPSLKFEQHLIGQIPKYLAALKALALQPPFVVMLTLVGVQGFWMFTNYGRTEGSEIDRDILVFPEIILDKFECRPPDLKPLLDSVWNASGVLQSPYFDASGRWSPNSH